MDQEQKKLKRRLKIILVVVLIIIIGLGIVIERIINENSECSRSPFVFAANTVIDTKTGEQIYTSCDCQTRLGSFYFDNKGLYKENPLLKGYRNPLAN